MRDDAKNTLLRRTNVSHDLSVNTKDEIPKTGEEPVQEAMNALAERIGLRKSLSEGNLSQSYSDSEEEAESSFIVTEQHGAVKEDSLRSESSIKKESAGGSAKGFYNDVERSVEQFLRPYIAQWLDEHFRDLFERILREEIQRLIKNLRY
ncbi:MAG: hypothetical protein JSC161_000159 [Candidatus Tokpelaia sp. JSC161]|jgi:cell pole-organizing protein PopZ|nr:MAG: hypothetical protein JSC161_000159 [Candidatus Tokpelaia sp. JSC161]